MKGSEGMPVGVQVITPAYEDELCLHIMGAIEKSLKFNSKNKPKIRDNEADGVLYHL